MKLTNMAAVLMVTSGLLSSTAVAQITNGKSPELPAPFATRSAGKPPEQTKPPEGFLPTVPAGFRVNVFASGFKEPRFLATAPIRANICSAPSKRWAAMTNWWC